MNRGLRVHAEVLRVRALVLVLILAGCGDVGDYISNDLDNGEDWPGWSGNYVEKNDQFKVNYNPDEIDGKIMGTIEMIWLEVQTCMGVSMPNAGLIIEYTPGSKIPNPYDGYIIYQDGYIRVDEDDWGYHWTLRHEFIHWILWELGTSLLDLNTHNSNYYDWCGG